MVPSVDRDSDERFALKDVGSVLVASFAKSIVVVAPEVPAMHARTLEDLTGKRFTVRPVVVFPGWFVERSREAAGSEVWVLEPKELQGWLRREPSMLPLQDVHLIQNRLRLLARQGRPKSEG